jgi:hypothetical protein
MNASDDVDLIVRSWLRDGVTTLPDRVLDDVLGRLPETRQQRSWWRVRRSHLNSSLKIALAFAAVLVAVVAGATLLPAILPVGVSPSAGPTSGSSPEVAVPLLASQVDDIDPGTYRVSTFDADVRITVPAGWHLFEDHRGFSAIVDDPTTSDGFRAVAFWSVAQTYADPCDRFGAQIPVGPSAGDLIAALSRIPQTRTSTPLRTSIGGLPATKIQLFVPRELPCAPGDFYLWDRRYVQGGGERDNIWVLEVDGERLLVLAEWLPGLTESDLTELWDMIDSIVIRPVNG